jgi:hypothetical protein
MFTDMQEKYIESSSGSESKPSKQPAENKAGDGMFLQNISKFLSNSELHCRR